MKIERAVREKTYTLTSIAGPSGSGKTYSAILYARGLVGPNGKIGLIDTENKRSRFYADIGGGFDVIDLDPPFTSARYVEAIKAFEDAGYQAIIIDSISHEWEGTGGVLEQAEQIEQATKRAGLHCWAKPKAGHKKMMNAFLQTSAHLIFCCRVKEKVVQVKTGGKTEIVNEGFVVVQEKAFIYEMTVSMMLNEGDHIPTIQKCPGDLLAALDTGRSLTEASGASVLEWSDQGQAPDKETEAAKRAGLLAANEGMKSLQKWWSGLDKPHQQKLASMKDTFKSIAEASDQIKRDIAEAGGGDAGERLAAARKSTQETTDTQEGFSAGFVHQETETLTGGPVVENEAAPEADHHDDDAGEDSIGNTEPTETPADTGPNREVLKMVFRRLYAAVGDDPSVVDDTANGLRDDLASENELTRAKASTIKKQLKLLCLGDVEREDMIEYLAGVIGVEPSELFDAAEDAA